MLEAGFLAVLTLTLRLFGLCRCADSSFALLRSSWFTYYSFPGTRISSCSMLALSVNTPHHRVADNNPATSKGCAHRIGKSLFVPIIVLDEIHRANDFLI